MKKNYKIIIFALIIVVIGIFIFIKNYNNIENVRARAIKSCIKNNYEYRTVLDSEGNKNDFCIVNSDKMEILEYYKIRKTFKN